jgi:hypothetical protein
VFRTCNAPFPIFIIYFVIKRLEIQIGFTLSLDGKNPIDSLKDFIKMLSSLIRS